MAVTGKAIARFIKMSPYKVRKVTALVKGKDVNAAFSILENLDKRAAIYLIRALKSAVASAKQSGKIKQEELYISKITADEGPMMKRYRAAAFGRAAMIRKRTSHILIELDKFPAPVKRAPVKETASGRAKV